MSESIKLYEAGGHNFGGFPIVLSVDIDTGCIEIDIEYPVEMGWAEESFEIPKNFSSLIADAVLVSQSKWGQDKDKVKKRLKS